MVVLRGGRNEANALKISMANAQGRLASEAGQAEAEVASRLLKRPFGVLEQHFAGNDHAVGGRFTVADLNLAEVVRYVRPYPPALEPFPISRPGWSAAMRPAFKAMYGKARLDEQE